MAERSSLQRAPGIGVDRIQPTGWIPPDGDWVWCFGQDLPRWAGVFNDADEVRIENSGDLEVTTKLIRARAYMRGPRGELPTGWEWRGYIEIAGTRVMDLPLEVGTGRELTDLIIPVRAYGGSIVAGLAVAGDVDPAELEIPAFYIDAFVLDDAPAALEIGNRMPVPGEVQVAQETLVRFTIIPTDGNSVDLSATTILVNGVVAYSGGDANGWTSTIIADAVAGFWAFELTPPAVFESLELVTVQVLSANNVASALLDSSWSFTIEDLTPPIVLSAVASGHRTVRVTFDESVRALGDGASADALTASAWMFETAAGEVAVDVESVGVESIDAFTVEITVDIPFTRNATYMVIAVGVEDLFGNAVVAPDDDAAFLGWACEFPADRDFDVWGFFPKIARQRDATGDLLKWATILQEIVDQLLCDIDGWTSILDPETAPEWAVDLILAQLGNPFEFVLTLAEKRKLALVLIDIYRQKGTAVGIINTVRLFLGLEVEIDEWSSSGWLLGVDELGADTILGPGTARELYTFSVISSIALTDEQRAAIRDLVEYMKPAHTHLGSIVEPETPTTIDHLELGLSELGVEWFLH